MTCDILSYNDTLLDKVLSGKFGFFTSLKFNSWDSLFVDLKEKYIVDDEDKEELKNFQSCFVDLMALSPIIYDVFKCRRPTINFYRDVEENEVYLKVCIPLNKDVENNYRNYETVCAKWFEIASQDTIDKVIIDLV